MRILYENLNTLFEISVSKSEEREPCVNGAYKKNRKKLAFLVWKSFLGMKSISKLEKLWFYAGADMISVIHVHGVLTESQMQCVIMFCYCC